MSTSRKSNGPVLRAGSLFTRSISPGGRFSGSISSNTTSFSSLHRPTSPSRVRFNALASPSSASSVRFSLDRSASPSRSTSVSARNNHHHHNQHQNQYNQGQNQYNQGSGRRHQIQKRTCLCSPTSHPGSFRCSMHKNTQAQSISYTPNRLAVRRSAMTNSLVRIGTVEGDLMKRALAALIRPSSHQIRRRNDFQPRPSRLSNMSKADDDVTVCFGGFLWRRKVTSDSGNDDVGDLADVRDIEDWNFE
ncbi:hypothetical protein LIER_38879 [Lithospermum erythrorhizon]|uniref:Serine-rich protein n=1 Tax=Lithospermum erythrorhizon TaxID=34254 RepID=A0AAV3Q6V2_LITER